MGDCWDREKKEEEDNKNAKKQTIFDEFLSESDWEHSESIYKNKILESKWFKKSKDYLDFNTFIKNIPSFHYFDSHSSNLEDKFKEKNFKSVFYVENFATHPKKKKLCRQGVPPNFMHQTLLKFFNIKIKIVFKKTLITWIKWRVNISISKYT